MAETRCSYPNLLRIAQGRRPKVGPSDSDDGQIGIGIVPNELGLEMAAV